MPLSLDSGAGAGLRYGLMCSDYLAFAGEKTSVCGASGGLKMTLPVTRGGGQGFTFRSDQRHQAGDQGFRVEYRSAEILDLNPCFSDEQCHSNNGYSFLSGMSTTAELLNFSTTPHQIKLA